MAEMRVVKFGASWCGPCRACLPQFVKLSETFPDVIFEDVDIEAERARAAASQISTIPTFVIFSDGREITRVVGAHMEQVEEALAALVADITEGTP